MKLLLVIALGLVACGGPPALSALDEMERIRTAPSTREGAELAPQTYAQAELERARAKQAQSSGDPAGAVLYAERAVAAYSHAFVLARLARATRDLDTATRSLAQADERARAAAARRAELDAQADALDKELRVLTERFLPAPSGPADPKREAARLVAARSLALQARLLCGAARLLAPQAPGLADVERELASLERDLETVRKAVPIDTAARVRAACLQTLTHTRRVAKAADEPDLLVAELSAAGGWEPARDERGVVVVLRGAFRGDTLTSDASAKLTSLARTAVAHPGYAVQVVLHDATPPTAAEAATNARRAERVVQALVDSGVTSVKSELAGARAPVMDPADTSARTRNARLELVLVSPSR
ncbi:MAG: hypothetical protein WCI05_01625 [Myxococcales bacterium]